MVDLYEMRSTKVDKYVFWNIIMDLIEIVKQIDAASIALGLGGLGGVAIMLRKLYAIFANDGLQIKGTEVQTDLIETLNKQTKMLSDSNDKLSVEVETLRVENVELKLTVGKLQDKNISLSAKVVELSQRCEELTVECNGLKDECNRLRNTINDLIQTINHK